MTRGLDEEFSLDEEDPEDTIDILNDARESLNINTNRSKPAQTGSKKRNAPSNGPTTKRSKPTEAVSLTSTSVSKSSSASSRSAIVATDFLTSSNWGKEVQPPFLHD